MGAVGDALLTRQAVWRRETARGNDRPTASLREYLAALDRFVLGEKTLACFVVKRDR